MESVTKISIFPERAEGEPSAPEAGPNPLISLLKGAAGRVPRSASEESGQMNARASGAAGAAEGIVWSQGTVLYINMDPMNRIGGKNTP